jgi:hypothetical protein
MNNLRVFSFERGLPHINPPPADPPSVRLPSFGRPSFGLPSFRLPPGVPPLSVPRSANLPPRAPALACNYRVSSAFLKAKNPLAAGLW